jgi:hypothetical protein
VAPPQAIAVFDAAPLRVQCSVRAALQSHYRRLPIVGRPA